MGYGLKKYLIILPIYRPDGTKKYPVGDAQSG